MYEFIGKYKQKTAYYIYSSGDEEELDKVSTGSLYDYTRPTWDSIVEKM
jgi:hypothetical protein